jgi:poly-beta-hydroxyalkanoate depolymerase
MLYLAYQTQSDMMAPLRAWAAVAKAAGDWRLLGDGHVWRNLTAAYELIARAGLTHTRPPFGITHVTVGNRDVEVTERRARRSVRFCTLGRT